MITTLNRWGNSLAVRIPKAFAEQIELDEDTPIRIEVENARITIEPVRAQWRLETLVAGITKSNVPAEAEWGTARGREVW